LATCPTEARKKKLKNDEDKQKKWMLQCSTYPGSLLQHTQNFFATLSLHCNFFLFLEHLLKQALPENVPTK
jgi:hypothetical protein